MRVPVVKQVTGTVTAFLLALAVPSAAATHAVDGEPAGVGSDPVDLVQEILDLTLDYVADFDPNDNVTTMKEKSEQFVDDVKDLVLDFMCMDFKIGLGLPGADAGTIFHGYITLYIPWWGYDEEADKEGVGIMTIEVGLDVACASLISEPDPPVRTDSIPLDADPEVLQSAAWNFRFLLPALS